MSHKRAGSRHWIWIIVLVFVAIVGLLWLRRGSEDRPEPSTASLETAEGATPQQADSATRSAAERDDGPTSDGEEDLADFDPNLDQDMIALRWSMVDLDALREAIPDNLYWKLGAPTTDPVVQRERDEERARWEKAYGKVLSGTASDEEITAYYDQRGRLSADYVEFASLVLQDYGAVLPARDIGLLELSLKMHHARLQQMPRRLTEALERKQRQDRLREAWLADEEAFGRAQADEVQRSLR